MSSFCIGRSDTHTQNSQNDFGQLLHGEDYRVQDEGPEALAHSIPFPSRPSSVTIYTMSPAYQVPRDITPKQMEVFDLIFSIDSEALNPFGHVFYQRDKSRGCFKWQRRTTRSALPAVHVRPSYTLADITFRVRLNEIITIYAHVPRDSWENATCDSRAVRAAIQKGYFSILQGDPRSIIVRAGMIPATIPEIKISTLETLRTTGRDDYGPSLELTPRVLPPSPPLTQGQIGVDQPLNADPHTRDPRYGNGSQLHSLERWVQMGGLSSAKSAAEKEMELHPTVSNNVIANPLLNPSLSPIPPTLSPSSPCDIHVCQLDIKTVDAQPAIVRSLHCFVMAINNILINYSTTLSLFLQNTSTIGLSFIIGILPFGAFIVGVPTPTTILLIAKGYTCVFHWILDTFNELHHSIVIFVTEANSMPLRARPLPDWLKSLVLVPLYMFLSYIFVSLLRRTSPIPFSCSILERFP